MYLSTGVSTDKLPLHPLGDTHIKHLSDSDNCSSNETNIGKKQNIAKTGTEHWQRLEQSIDRDWNRALAKIGLEHGKDWKRAWAKIGTEHGKDWNRA